MVSGYEFTRVRGESVQLVRVGDLRFVVLKVYGMNGSFALRIRNRQGKKVSYLGNAREPTHCLHEGGPFQRFVNVEESEVGGIESRL